MMIISVVLFMARAYYSRAQPSRAMLQTPPRFAISR